MYGLGVSISPDGSYIAAGSKYNVYFFTRNVSLPSNAAMTLTVTALPSKVTGGSSDGGIPIPAITSSAATPISGINPPPGNDETNWIMMIGKYAVILIGIISLIVFIKKLRKKNLDAVAPTNAIITSIELRRTVYDPVAKNFVSDKSLDYPEIMKWITSHPPLDYWYILRIDNLGCIVEQWAVELETHIALSIKEVYIDGFEQSFPLNREHLQWKDKYMFRLPKELGIPLPSNGTRRLYFRLNIDCTTALMPRYAISGKLIANDVIPIPEKDFPFSCELRKLKKVWAKKPDEIAKYADGRARELYSLDAARAIADALKLYYEINKLIETGYVDENTLRNGIKNLIASLENVKKRTAVERPLKLVEESLDVMEITSVDLIMKRWKEMNLFDVMMTELLKVRDKD